jgi:Tol biopolymer transport system component
VNLRLLIFSTVTLGLLLAGTACSSDDDPPEAAGPAVKPVGPCRIAFRVKVADYDDAPSDIYVVNPDGTGQRNLTRARGLTEWSPVWSPDGRKIAFSASPADRVTATQIFVMNADGSRLRQLTRSTSAYSDMGTWSPDDRAIFYTRLDLAGNTRPWAMNADGTGKRQVAGLPSPDGRLVVSVRNSGVESDYYGSPDVYVSDKGGGNGHWLTHSGDTDLFGWSPDGQWIFYKRWASIEKRAGSAPGLYVVKPDGSARTRLTHTDADYDATWSPGGRLILFSRQSSSAGIYVVSRAGGTPRRLTRRANDLSASWSPGGTRIVFYRFLGEIWMMNRDGTNVRPVARPEGTAVYESPAWSPACR